MTDSLHRHLFASFPLTLAVTLASYLTALGDGPPEIPGFKLDVQGHVLSFTSIDGKLPKDLVIPRMFNGIKGISILQGQKEIAGSVQPEIQTWKLSWPTTASDLSGGKVVLELDSAPRWEAKAVRPEADGSFRLRACEALTKGSKLRYEPQPHKNTVGYWVDASDYAWWTLQVDRPGKFNLAALQGCGAGQGGSKVTFPCSKEGSGEPAVGSSSLELTIAETGHFQNFQWRHVGEIHLTEQGVYRLEVRCNTKAKGAVGDIREIHLSRLP